MPSKDGFVFKPPHFPRFDSIVPSAIFNGDSRRLYYIRWVIRAIVAILFTVTCCLFGSTVAARVVFGRNVHECTGTIGEVHHSNDHSVSVVIPQIAMAIFILTFAVVFMSYNVLVQFLIVLTILEGVTFLVWKYQFPVGSVELEKHLFVRIVTRRMIKCHVISNRTAVEPCWERFMTDYCQEWAATEIRLCPMTTTTVQPSSTVFPEIRNASVGDNTSPVMTNIYRCYKRFMKHPWTNVTREEEYMEVLSPHVKALMSVHVITVTFLYLAARTYVREFRRLRDDWIMELQMYYIRLNNTVKEFKESYPDCSAPWGRLIDKHVVWDSLRCDVCKDDPDGAHCRAWIMYPEEEFQLPAIQPSRPQHSEYFTVVDHCRVANGNRVSIEDDSIV